MGSRGARTKCLAKVLGEVERSEPNHSCLRVKNTGRPSSGDTLLSDRSSGEPGLSPRGAGSTLALSTHTDHEISRTPALEGLVTC